MQISASAPTDIVPFLGYNPNKRAAFVDVTATNVCKSILPLTTPSEKVMGIRVSRPGTPLAI